MKKKALVLAICMAFSTPAASATKLLKNDLLGINLGEIQSESYLNEPFKGFIPILFATNKRAAQLKVSIAPSSIFSKIGIEKSKVLKKLIFKVRSHNKKPIIEIVSQTPIHLPFLSFVLEIESPQGSIYQDYTIMLDPKNLNDELNISSFSKVKNNAMLPIIYTTAASSSNSKVKQYKVLSGDSLSKIAQKFKVNNTSLNIMMEGIFIKNPKAFINNDINRIKAGAALTLPTAIEIANTTIRTDNTDIKGSQATQIGHLSATKPTSNQYTVLAGDTLGKITKTYHDGNMSFTKLMHSIYQENPQAFSNNKINVLKIGAVLNIPITIDTKTNNKVVSTKISESVSTEISKTDKITKTKVSSQLKEVSNDINVINMNPIKKASQSIATEGTTAVPKLEKRVRELRAELLNVHESTKELESLVIKKELLIKKQKTEIRDLQSHIEEYIETEVSETFVAQKITSKEDTSLSTSPTFVTDSNLGPQEPAEAYNKEVSLNTSTPTEIGAIKYSSYIPKEATEEWMDTQVAEIRKFASTRDLSYGALALILGLLWLRYRRELYSYTKISRKPSAKASVKTYKRKKRNITYQNTLVNPEDTIPTEIITSHSHKEIDNSQIQECEILVDDLLKDLEENHIDQYNHEPIITNFCASEINILKEDKSIESLNLFQEILDDSKINDENAVQDILRELQEDPEKALNKIPEDNISNVEKWAKNVTKRNSDVVNIHHKKSYKEISSA